MRYSKVSRRMWADEKFRGLSRPQPCGQALWFWLLTGAATSSIPGLLAIGEQGAAEALGWSLTDFRSAFAEIEAAGMAEADWERRIVFLPRAIEHNKPASPNVVKSWVDAWYELPECALRDRAWAVFFVTLAGKYREQFVATIGIPRNIAESLAPAISEAFPEAFAKAFPKGFREALPEALPKAFAEAFPKALREAFPKGFGKAFAESGSGSGTEEGTGEREHSGFALAHVAHSLTEESREEATDHEGTDETAAPTRPQEPSAEPEATDTAPEPQKPVLSHPDGSEGPVKGKRGRGRQQRTFMRQDWQPSEACYRRLCEEYETSDVDATIRDVRLFWLEKGEQRANWDATLERRMLALVGYGRLTPRQRPRQASMPVTPPAPPATPEQEAMYRAQIAQAMTNFGSAEPDPFADEEYS